MAVPIAVVLAIEFVVLVLVADQVAQGEAVVRGNEVDAGLRRASGVAKDLTRSGQALGEAGYARFTR